MAVNISGDTGIDKITDGSVVQADLASGITVDSLSTASGSAPSYSARAWVNFNGTGTVAIYSSGNVSSITDTGTGLYTVNFTTAISDANYSAVMGVKELDGSGLNGDGSCLMPYNFATTSVKLAAGTNAGNYADMIFVNVAIFR